MRSVRFIPVIILSLLCLGFASSLYHRVKFVYDGDTILLLGGDKVRYLGIDAPEIDHKGGKSQFMAHEAREYNVQLVENVQLRLEFDGDATDAYGRHLAYVFLKNGEMVNAALVRKGLARVLFKTPNLRYKDYLLICQRKAMEERVGIWTKPWTGGSSTYSGNSRTHTFHNSGCPFEQMISGRNRVRFNSRYDAFWAGYSPCKRCGP